MQRLITATEELKKAIESVTVEDCGVSKRWRHGLLKKKTKSRLGTRKRKNQKKIEFTPEDALRAAGMLDAEPLSNIEDEQEDEEPLFPARRRR